MSEWEIFDGVFWITIATIVVGSFGLSVKYCLKSKCEHLDLCCGCIKIDRRVDLEVAEEMKSLEMGLPIDGDIEENKI